MLKYDMGRTPLPSALTELECSSPITEVKTSFAPEKEMDTSLYFFEISS